MNEQLQQAKQAFEIAKRNLQFVKASAAQKRVIIAQDVIRALESRQLMAESGTYIDNVRLTDDDKIESCTVCALGAVFVCSVQRDQEVLDTGETLSDLADYCTSPNAMRAQLEPYFGDEQLRLIESAFEGDDFGAATTSAKTERAIKYFNRTGDDDKRLIKIMKNVIANNGTFKP